MSNLKNGKKPLSSRPVSPFGAPEEFGNALTIPANIKADLEKTGRVARWINSKKLAEFQGYHPKGWVPYKLPDTMRSADSFKFGNDPEGIVRRGDCILACKSAEQGKKHKDYLNALASQSKNINAQKANELRAMMRNQGIEGKVHEGYEENEGKDSDEE